MARIPSTNIPDLSTPGAERYEALDGFRAYAAVGIVAMHVLANAGISGLPAGFVFDALIPWFTDFTLLFMILSGFSLSCGYFTRIQSGAITPAKFYRRRIERILPFFALMAIAETAVTFSSESLMELYADLTLCFGLLPEADIEIIGVGWFIGVVMVYYMIYPFVVALQSSRRSSWLTMMAVTVLVAMGCFYSFNRDIPEPLLTRADILYCLPLFLAGGLLFHYRKAVALASRQHPFLWAVLAVGATVLFFLFPVYRLGQFQRLASDGLLFTLWTMAVLGIRPAWLAGKSVRWLAAISLEIYLCHMPCFRILQKIGVTEWFDNPVEAYFLTLSLTLLMAVITAYVGKFHIVNPLLKLISERQKNH